MSRHFRSWAITILTTATQAQLYNTVIDTQYGPVQGVPAFNSSPKGDIANWNDITVWKGIPFAASTAAENRFRPPQPRSRWNSTFQATTYGDTCPSSLMGNTDGYTVSEDCLNLNIWTSATNTSEKRPVVLWSYPAGGANSQPLFDGAGMASKDLVFVNYNYRAGAFGWLVTSELTAERYAETGVNSSGNWGILDEFAALRWVHENIASFGGDPARITVMGQSAGSAAVYHMVNGPLVKGLIAGAIAESGVRDPYDPLASSLAENYKNLTYRYMEGSKFLAYLNVSTIQEARQLPYEDLIVSLSFGPPSASNVASTSANSFSFGTTLDYYAVPDKYIHTLQHGPANDVPFITGNTKDESGASTSTDLTVTSYIAALQTQYGNATAAEFLAQYPAANSTQADMSYNAHYRDTSRISSWLFANRWPEAATSPIYTYYWDHAPPGQDEGAFHESEINYVLNNLYGTDLPWEAEDYEITAKMNAYWVNFARTGNPNTGGAYTGNETLATWSYSTPSKQVTQHVGDGWGDVAIAEPAQVELISRYFASQSPF